MQASGPVVALDGMGGDYAPAEVVKGAIMALRADVRLQLILVGDESAIRTQLARREGGLVASEKNRIEVVHAPEVISMSEAATALRRKPESSILRAMEQVKIGSAQAVVAAGSTGAAMSAALLRLGRIKGIERPAIAAILPTHKGPCVLLDVGANVDCRPEWLSQFAIMGAEYARLVLDIPIPRVGLLNIGEEPGKGNDLAVASFGLLKEEARAAAGLAETTWDFVGNVEGHAIWRGIADVVVADGFAGNIALKTAEGVAKFVGDLMIDEIGGGGLRAKLGAILMTAPFRGVRRRTDPAEYGGALLVGVDGVCVICHGSSHAYAVANAIRVARDAAASGYLRRIRSRLASQKVTNSEALEPIAKPDTGAEAR